ncbi:MAG: CBS domain-containing protein [Brevinematales bacterium]|nr:CBS domain-containing protein [Brevinematales bacterium]
MAQESDFSKGKMVILEELAKINVGDIMVPRSEVVLIDKDLSLEQILNLVVEDGHSRFPVYEGQIDNILGVLYVKDLLKFFKKRDFKIETILREPIFVPENKTASDLLKEFKEKRIHFAIVVNEYGTMVGVVCLEDIIEEIVGEIEDEYDKKEEVSYKKLTKNEYIIFPKMSIEEFNKVFKTRIVSEDFDTIGGFILESFGYLPKSGDVIEYGNYIFVVKSVDGSKIKEILLKKR